MKSTFIFGLFFLVAYISAIPVNTSPASIKETTLHREEKKTTRHHKEKKTTPKRTTTTTIDHRHRTTTTDTNLTAVINSFGRKRRAANDGGVVSLSLIKHKPIWKQMIQDGTWKTVREQYHKRRQNKNNIRLQSKNGVPLQNKNSVSLGDYYDTCYRVQISTGTPPQNFNIDLDTGSADFWLISNTCKDTPCNGQGNAVHSKYDPSHSSTYQNDGQYVSISYQTGQMEGFLATDVINIGGLQYSQQQFGLATSLSDNFAETPIDGILGLGFAGNSQFEVNPPMTNLLPQLTQPIITTWLKHYPDIEQDAPGGQLTLGGLDHEHCSSTIHYVPLSDQVSNTWDIIMSSIKMGSTAGGYTDCVTLVDTGTSVLMGPQDDTDTFAVIVGATWDDDTGLYLMPSCSKQGLPDLVLTIDGHNYPIKPDHYVIVYQKSGSNEQCALALWPLNDDSFDWILGDPFINSYCITFDYGKKRVGISNKLVD